ncbi:MAG: hypothetical protein GY811_01610 [Myxococcales bacterium]|nr:hypothetical protein [Myxococcales bacterium]
MGGHRAILDRLRGLGRTLSLVALVSCDKGPVDSGRPAIDARAVAAYLPLVGTWSGSLQVDSVGMATGVVTVGPSGGGTFFVTVAGVQETGQLQIVALSEFSVWVRAMGQERGVPIAIEEDLLRVSVAGVGEVVLLRVE